MSHTTPHTLSLLAAMMVLGCRSNIQDVTAEISESVATVATVRWSTDEAATGYIEFGLTDRYGMQTPSTAKGTEHTAVLLGMHADTTYHYRVVGSLDGEEITSDDLTLTTNSLPSQLPTMTFDGDADSWQGYIPVPLIGTLNAAVIIDSDGEIVWYHLLEDDSLGPRRVFPSQDGEGVYFNTIDGGSSSYIHWVAWDGEHQRSQLVSGHNHDFIEKPDGDLIAMVYDNQEVSGEFKRGDKLVTLSPDGTVTDLWSIWDSYTYDVLPINEDTWTHANALRYDAEANVAYLGLRNFSTIVKLDVETATVEWGLGTSPISDYTFAEDTEPFFRQHHFQFIEDDRLLVFDNHTTGDDESRVVEYAIDHGTRTLEEVWRFEHDPELTIYALGEAHRSDDGDTFISWSTGGELQRVSEAGEVEWQLNTELGYAFGYSTPVEALQ
ncbi:MAG: hypothetical protein ACI8RZ_004201 [Myxococcota bacterium]|jgi:hypothetical protein